MHLVDLHVPTSRRSLGFNPDLRSLAATQAKRIATSDLRHCTTTAGGTTWVYITSKSIKQYCSIANRMATITRCGVLLCGKSSWPLARKTKKSSCDADVLTTRSDDISGFVVLNDQITRPETPSTTTVYRPIHHHHHYHIYFVIIHLHTKIQMKQTICMCIVQAQQVITVLVSR